MSRESAAAAAHRSTSFRAHDYGLIPVERYFELKGKRQLDYISSQGCNFRCAFCSDPFVYGRKWVGLEPVRMALRLKELWDRYHFDDVNFQDETFFTKRDRVQALADRIIESGMKITWAATMRADQGVRLPDEVWARCKQSGLRRLLVGVESGSNEMLKRIRKDIKIEQVFETARKNASSTGSPVISRSSSAFRTKATRASRRRSICAKRLRSMSPDFLTPIYYFKPYPGSELVIEAVARGFAAGDARGLVAVRLRGGRARAVGVAGEVRAHRALQVLPRAGLEARVPRQAAAAAARALSLQHATSTAGRSRCC